ncbi:MAG: biotin/lipoyl-binding protein, partial [Primorskyibacter sp.]
MLSLRPLILTFALWGGLTPRVVLSAVLASGMLASGAWAQGRPAGVSTQTIDMRQMSETVAAFGQIVSGRESAVAARVPGVVTSVAVRVGDQVAQGAVLAQLDTERLDIQLARAQADIAIAEAGIAVASARLERAETALRRTES